VHEIAHDLPAAGADELAAELTRRWPRLGLPAGWVTDQQRTRALEMTARLASYYRRMADQGRELVDVERSVRVTIGRAVVTGQVDRLERTAEGGWYIVDLKTGRTQVSDEDVAVNPQLGIYQLAAQAGGFGADDTRADGGELVMIGVPRVNLPVKRQPPLPAPDDAPEGSWARDLLDRAAEGMSGAAYTAQQGPHCRSCPVRTSCPVQPEGRPVTA
jgi:RecB family exonuclease